MYLPFSLLEGKGQKAKAVCEALTNAMEVNDEGLLVMKSTGWSKVRARWKWR